MQLQLKMYRKQAKMSQAELAAMLGVSVRTVGAWERGENQPDADQIWRCAEALGLSPNEIYGWVSPDDSGATPAEQDSNDSMERQLIDAFHSMNAVGKASLVAVARSLASIPCNQV